MAFREERERRMPPDYVHALRQRGVNEVHANMY